MPFSGSFAPEDVTFLLTPIALAPTEVHEKERLIQTGRRHYSEMIGREDPPSPVYREAFDQAFRANRARYGRDLSRLARCLDRHFPADVVLVSLARAGTPVGVLLRRALSRIGRSAHHYSISIIRDRGIDEAALDYILDRHDPTGVVFVDGWTGKGAIAGELERSLAGYRSRSGHHLAPTLAVVSDLAGVATIAATSDDYLIPTAILNAVVSGLVSRTILNDEVRRAGSFHGCVVYDHLAPHDLSRWVADEITRDIEAALAAPEDPAPIWDDARRAALRRVSREFVEETRARFGVTDPNRIKPGIGEATRALLRRVPDRLVVQQPSGDDLEHLLLLARERGVSIEHDPDLPYRAAVIIKTLGK